MCYSWCRPACTHACTCRYASHERVVGAAVAVEAAGASQDAHAPASGVRVRLTVSALAPPERAWGVEREGGHGQSTTSGFRVGDEAMLHGLVKAAGFNGLRCTVIGTLEKGDRYPVQITQAGVVKSMLVRIENLAHAGAVPCVT